MLKKSSNVISLKGFSLLEISIVLVIMSIVLLATLTIGKYVIDNINYNNTAYKLRVIHHSMLNYLAKNGSLPCPADLNIDTANSVYGIAQVHINNNGPNNCIAKTNSIFIQTNENEAIYMGAVPVRSLGISDNYIIDDWNNKITYVVQRSFINNENAIGCFRDTANADNHTLNGYICFPSQASGSQNPSTPDIEIFDSAAGRMINNDAIYLLISHGPNGLGAFRHNADGNGPNQDRNPLPSFTTQLDERYNTNCSITSNNCSDYAMESNRFSLGMEGASSKYDDIILFKTRNQLVLECNQQYGNICSNLHAIDIK